MAEQATLPIVPTAPAPPRMSRMSTKNFAGAAFRYNEWAADLDENQEMDDVFNPRFWVDQAATLMGFDKTQPKGLMDIIHVRKRDAMQYAKLMVVEIGAGYIKTVLIEAAAARPVTLPETSALAIKWNPARKAHDVIRRADNVVLSGGYQTKDAAKAWIDQHTKAMAA